MLEEGCQGSWKSDRQNRFARYTIHVLNRWTGEQAKKLVDAVNICSSVASECDCDSEAVAKEVGGGRNASACAGRWKSAAAGMRRSAAAVNANDSRDASAAVSPPSDVVAEGSLLKTADYELKQNNAQGQDAVTPGLALLKSPYEKVEPRSKNRTMDLQTHKMKKPYSVWTTEQQVVKLRNAVNAVKPCDANGWKAVAKEVGKGRDASSCMSKWYTVNLSDKKNPNNVKQGRKDLWTDQEERKNSLTR